MRHYALHESDSILHHEDQPCARNEGEFAMFVHHSRLTVQWGDCDPAGIVFFPNYLKWCDDFTSALFAAAALPLHTLFCAHSVIGIPIVDVRASFKIPAAFGDELAVKTSVHEWRTSSFVVQHLFYKQAALAVEAHVTRVWTGADPAKKGAMKSRPLPREIIDRLSSSSEG
jgi:4-hydroxybenzoyl-CoA thioesterase